MQFTALQTFEYRDGDRLVAVYTTGLSYTVRPGNDKLAAKVQQWIAEKKVALGVLRSDAGTIRGRG